MTNQPLGLLQVYTGSGKGKTTAAVGLAVRAAGKGLKVAFIQFAKPDASGELASLQTLGISCSHFGAPGWVSEGLDNSPHITAARSGWQAANLYLAGDEQVDLLVLDEINVVLTLGLLDCGQVISSIINRPHGLEVICTGRDAPEELVQAADLVTEMGEIKHYFQKGIGAREGIEY